MTATATTTVMMIEAIASDCRPLVLAGFVRAS